MMISEEFFIFGEPVETDIGLCHFLTMRDYQKMHSHLDYVKMSKLEIIYRFQKENKLGKYDELIQTMEHLELFDIVNQLPVFAEAYEHVFKHAFRNEFIMDAVDKDNFYNLRALIMRMNCMKEEPINPNPEIQRAWERSKRVKSQMAEKITLADMASSISAFGSKPSYNNIADMTIYQFFMEYQRIAQGFAYETATLFATVSTEKMKIDSWSKNIDLYEVDKHELDEATANKIKQAF